MILLIQGHLGVENPKVPWALSPITVSVARSGQDQCDTPLKCMDSTLCQITTLITTIVVIVTMANIY